MEVSPPLHLEPSGSREETPFPKPKRSSSWLQWTHLAFYTGRPIITLKTSPVNSLLRAGSGHFLSFTWDLLSFLCQQLSSSTQAGRGLFSEASQVAKKTGCFTLACQGRTALCCPPAACSPTDVHTSCLPAGDTRGSTAFPAQAPRPPHNSCSLSWSRGGGSSRPSVWRFRSNMNLEKRPAGSN